MIAAVTEWLLLALARLVAHPRWQGCAPSPEQRIYVANHSSHLDALLVLSALPEPHRRKTRPVASAEYWNNSSVRRFLIHSVFRGVLLGPQGEFNPLEPVADALRQGDSLIFFPEGTRGPGVELQPLKPGIYHLARWFRDIDIVPVWIDNSYRIMPKGIHWPLLLPCSITFGVPLRIKEKQRQEEFLTDLRASLEAARPK
jgi:1-acyl-sn-glycerol-3-phosphate acyltransferase